MPLPLIPIITAVAPVIGELIDRAFPDSAEREAKRLEYNIKMQEVLNSIDLAQVEVNKIEAQNNMLFVAGWRPFIGWVCGAAFAYHFVLLPFLVFIIDLLGYQVTPPVLDIGSLVTVLMGMLGLGTMRSVEKVKGVTTGLAGTLPWKSNN